VANQRDRILVDSSIDFAIAAATLLDREPFLRRAARSAHRPPVFLDYVAWIGVAVLVALGSTSRIGRRG
jgi:hypothetical protein